MRRNGIEGTHTATTTRENNRASADLNQKPHRVITAITTSRAEKAVSGGVQIANPLFYTRYVRIS
jgi:hypothetical protein